MRVLNLTAAIVLLGSLAVGVAGCGVRGSLDLPAEAKAKQKRAAAAESGQGKPEGKAPKPHKPFVLDGLLR